MQTDPSSDRDDMNLDHDGLHTGGEHDTELSVALAPAMAMALADGESSLDLVSRDIDLPSGPWTPPVQEPLLDAELVAILLGDNTGHFGDVAGDSPAGEESAYVDSEGEGALEQDPTGEADAAEGDDAPQANEPPPEELVRATAALLLASPEALTIRRLAELLGGTKPKVAAAALALLGERFEAAGLPFVVRELAGGWRLFTDPAMSEVVQRLDASRKVEKISPAALESLAIVAYRQPVTKAEIEAIRGVQAGPILRTLVDRGLVKVAGRADQPGSPLLYGTTQAFLDRFGLASLADLPRDGELARD